MIKPGSAEKEEKENEAFFKKVRLDIKHLEKKESKTAQDTQTNKSLVLSHS